MSRSFSRPVRHTRSAPVTVIGAVLTLAFLGWMAYLAIHATRGVPLVSYYTLKARLADTHELRPLDEVRVDGRRAGTITNISYDGNDAVVTLQLDSSYDYLRSDTTARVRTRNLLGLQYIDLTPGLHGTPLHNDATIPVSQTSDAVDYGRLLSTFNAPTRLYAQETTRGLGGGFLGRGVDLNGMLGRGPVLFGQVTAISNAILARDGAARNFAPSAESLAAAYDPVREQLAQGFEPEARALAPFSEQATRSTLEQAPPALSALRQGLDASTPLLDQTARLGRALSAMTKPAPVALRETTALLREGEPALTRTRPLLRALRDATSPTLSFLQRLDPVVEPTDRALRNQLRLMLTFGDRPCDVLGWAANWRSAMSYGVPTGTDPISNLDNSQGIGPLTSFRFLAVPPDNQEALNPDARPTVAPAIGQDSYPASCQAVSERKG